MEAEIRSWQGKALASLRTPNQPPAEPQMVQVQLEDGSVVAMPRDPAAWLAHQKAQWQAEMRQEFEPVTKTIGQLQQEREAAVREHQISHFVTTTYDDVQTWPGMESAEAKTSLATELANANVDPNDPRDVALALDRAYRKVILPTLGRQAEAKLLDSLKTKAVASTSVNPGSAAPSAPRTVTKFTDLPPDAWR